MIPIIRDFQDEGPLSLADLHVVSRNTVCAVGQSQEVHVALVQSELHLRPMTLVGDSQQLSGHVIQEFCEESGKNSVGTCFYVFHPMMEGGSGGFLH